MYIYIYIYIIRTHTHTDTQTDTQTHTDTHRHRHRRRHTHTQNREKLGRIATLLTVTYTDTVNHTKGSRSCALRQPYSEDTMVRDALAAIKRDYVQGNHFDGICMYGYFTYVHEYMLRTYIHILCLYICTLCTICIRYMCVYVCVCTCYIYIYIYIYIYMRCY